MAMSSSCDDDLLLLDQLDGRLTSKSGMPNPTSQSNAQNPWQSPPSLPHKDTPTPSPHRCGDDEDVDEYSDVGLGISGDHPSGIRVLGMAGGLKRRDIGDGSAGKSGSSDGSERDEISDVTKGSKRIKGSDGFKKDREEWSDAAISALLEAYTEKFVELNKGNLRGRHWEEVASYVSSRCQGSKAAKTIEQCKNKVDSLKKRHKVERNRMEMSGSASSPWPWFAKVDQIVGPLPKLSMMVEDEIPVSKGFEKQRAIAASFRQKKPTDCRIQEAPMVGRDMLCMKPKVIQPKWRRILLKVSGEALIGDGAQNIDPKVTITIAREVAVVTRLGVEVAIVVGGGNFFRGANWVGASGLDRASADHIGMMATVMNSIFLQASLESVGIPTRVQTAYRMAEVAEPYIRRRAIRHMEKGRVVIFGGGTGNPFFTTDTAAALRAAEINAEVLLKATTVDGIFENDPKKILLDHISYREAALKGQSVMDMTALTLCQENNIPVVLFNLNQSGNISRALTGEHIGTLIDQTGKIH